MQRNTRKPRSCEAKPLKGSEELQRDAIEPHIRDAKPRIRDAKPLEKKVGDAELIERSEARESGLEELVRTDADFALNSTRIIVTV